MGVARVDHSRMVPCRETSSSRLPCPCAEPESDEDEGKVLNGILKEGLRLPSIRSDQAALECMLAVGDPTVRLLLGGCSLCWVREAWCGGDAAGAVWRYRTVCVPDHGP